MGIRGLCAYPLWWWWWASWVDGTSVYVSQDCLSNSWWGHLAPLTSLSLSSSAFLNILLSRMVLILGQCIINSIWVTLKNTIPSSIGNWSFSTLLNALLSTIKFFLYNCLSRVSMNPVKGVVLFLRKYVMHISLLLSLKGRVCHINYSDLFKMKNLTPVGSQECMCIHLGAGIANTVHLCFF